MNIDTLIKSAKIKVSQGKTDVRKGLVFSIQSHSVHDGPGTRTAIFMNDCSLRCKWCCNPEGLFSKPVLLHSSVKCVQCGDCIKVCPHGAITLVDGSLEFNRKLCDSCTSMECVEACLHDGNSVSGKFYTVEDLMHRFNRERHFWGEDGGITLSGGEPLLQKDFILPLLKKCKEGYIHTCIETTANVNSDYWLDVLQYVDWVFTDIKHMDTVKHKSMTGVNNNRILKNIKLLAEAEWWNGFVVPRIPVIPGFNDDIENIRATAKFVKSIGLEVINILPFHKLGESKYRQLGREYSFIDQDSPSPEHMNDLKQVIQNEGVVCFVGYDTPF